MSFSKSPYFFPALLSLVLCGVMCAAGLYARPLFPVDETRYLSVAWEMREQGHWILPTLNFEPYHHKPPVLFWLINLMWSLFGVSQQAAMIVPYLAAFSVLMLTSRLARRLFPDAPNAPLLSVIALGGLFPFVVYANVIMFDLLLTVFVLIGVTAVYDYLHEQKKIHLLTLALAIGVGAVTKGPVILLHIFPILLLMKFWMTDDTRPSPRKIVMPLLAAVGLGVVIGLCWAIPAAIEGGKEFAEKIFYGQTTGRVVNAFDHKRPIFWYLTFIPLFFLPWALSPRFWNGLRSAYQANPAYKKIIRMLSCWIIPVFIAFSFISGKQVHYLIPLLPPIALLCTVAFLSMSELALRKRDFLPLLLCALFFTLVPVIADFISHHLASVMPRSVHIDKSLSDINALPPVSLAILIIAISLSLSFKRHTLSTLVAVTMSMGLMISSFQLSAKDGFFRNYDLSGIGEILQQNPDRPVAYLGGYNGELSFIGRLTRPVTLFPEKRPKAEWFEQNPNGIGVVFTRTPEDFTGYTVLYSMPYKMTNTYLVIEAPQN